MEEIMSLKQIKNEILKNNNKLKYWLDKKDMNYELTQPKGMKVKDVMVHCSIKESDPFLTYMIKDEECDIKIYKIKREIARLQVMLADEIIRMKQNKDDLDLIVYYKEELNLNWFQIDKELHYAEGGAKKKYQRYKRG